MGKKPPKTVHELCDRYERHAKDYYRDSNGRPTREHYNVADAARSLAAVVGTKSPRLLAAEDLCRVQKHMVKQGLTRETINARVNRIRRMNKRSTVWCS